MTLLKIQREGATKLREAEKQVLTMRENLRARLTQKGITPGGLRWLRLTVSGGRYLPADKHARTISRSGIVLLISGLATLVVAGSRLCHFAFVKSGINDFMIDVPGLLLPSAGHGEASDVFSSAMPFTSAFSGYLSSPLFTISRW